MGNNINLITLDFRYQWTEIHPYAKYLSDYEKGDTENRAKSFPGSGNEGYFPNLFNYSVMQLI